MAFHGGINEEGANMLSVYLSGPCFGDATPSESPNSSAYQSALHAQQEDGGKLEAHDAPQHQTLRDNNGVKEGEGLFDYGLNGRSYARFQPRIEALIDLDDGGAAAGAYSAPGRQAQLHIHEDLLDLSFEPHVQQQQAQQVQSHEDLTSIALETHIQLERRATPGVGRLENTLQTPGEQHNMPVGVEDHLDSQELGGYQSGDDGYGSSPHTSGDPLYEDEVDELDEEYAENGISWPIAQWRDAESNVPSSSPPQVYSSSPAVASSQTSISTDVDEDRLYVGTKDGDSQLQRLTLSMLKDHLGQMDKTEMNAANFQDNTGTHPEMRVLSGDVNPPSPLTPEQDAFEAEPILRGEVVRDNVEMHETRYPPDADADSDSSDNLEARGVLPLGSPPRDGMLGHPSLYVVAPFVRVQPTPAQAPRSRDDEGDEEEARGTVSPQRSPLPAVGQVAVHLESSPGPVDEDHMSDGGPGYGNQQADKSEDEARGMHPTSSSIPGNLRLPGSIAESIEYGLDLDSHLGEGEKGSISSDIVNAAPVEGHNASPVHAEPSVSPSAEDSRVVRAEARAHHATDKQGKGVAEHDAQNAQVIRKDSRESGDTTFVDLPATDDHGYSAEQVAFEFPPAETAFEEDTALSHDQAEYDDSPVFDGYQESQGLGPRSVTLPEFNYRPDGKAQGKPGTQEDTSGCDLRSLKRRGWRAAVAAEERESPRRPTYPSPPNPKRTTAAGQLLQHKKLSKPFKCPTISNPPSTKAAAACKPRYPQSLPQVKQETQIESHPQVAVSERDTKIKHRTQRAGAQFKLPLTSLPSRQQALIKPTPTIRALERNVQTLKRAVRVVKDKEEATLLALIAKWTEAGREVAYELWIMVKDCGGDGSSSDRAMDGEGSLKRQVEESWGWDNGNERKKLIMGNGSKWGWDSALEGDAEHGKDEERHDASEEHDEGEGEIQETIGTMLMQLGVCPSTLGWDGEEGCFVG